MFVPPDADSDVAEFLLTPTRTGRLLVLVELQWEDALRGSRSLLTECIAEATSLPTRVETNVVRMPISVSESNVQEERRDKIDAAGPKVRKLIKAISDRERTAGEPPPVVKYVIWFLDRENWVKHRTAIVIAVLGLALIGGFEIVPKILNTASKSTASTGSESHSSRSTTPQVSDDRVGHLSDDDAMPAIEKALADGDVGESIRLVSLMSQGLGKTNECEHVYNYTMKYARLNEAKSIVELCWEGEIKQKKLDEILHERLKK